MTSSEKVLMLCDVVDSTATTERLGDTLSAELWRTHDTAARALLADWDGHEVDKTDGLLALFGGASDALGFAESYHRALASLEPPLAARVAVFQGTVLLRQTPADEVARGAKPLEVDGLAKPITARIAALAQSGQTLVSESAVRGLSCADSFQALGSWCFKGVSEPINLYEPSTRPRGSPPDGAKAWRVTRVRQHWLPTREQPHTLPAERDTFVGRQADLTNLAARFDEPGTRLVTLLGMGGTGKTRLALHHGWDALGAHAGGVWFCDLSQATSFDGVLHAAAQGLQLPLGAADPVQQIGLAIAGRGDCLVIFDNLEQVVRHAEPTLGRWLAAAPQARFLVTSREVLGIAGEQTIALPPMARDEGATLFVRRAQAAHSGFEVSGTDDTHSAIKQLVDMLDGLPLAIELAAARVRVLAPDQMLARMGERFKLLAAPGKRHDRQATLLATLDWSWELLSDPERSGLVQLSVFEGGFTLAAAEVVVDLSAFGNSTWVVDVVQGLVQKSLVRALDRDRFDMLRSVQDYARMPRDNGAGPALALSRRRHALHFASISDRSAVAARCADADNLVAACRNATADGATHEAVGALVNAWAALRLTGPFGVALAMADRVVHLAGLDSDERARAEVVAASALDAMGRNREAHARLIPVLEGLAPGSRALCRVYCVAGEIASNLGLFDEAASQLLQAQRHAEAHADVETQCRAHNALGWLAYWRARSVDARTHYLTALDLARQLADMRWEGGLLGNLGVLEHSLGRHEEARSHYERALVLARENGDRRWEANARCNLGLLHQELGRNAEARVHHESALAMARHMGHRKLEGTVLCNLGHLAEAMLESDSARMSYELAVEIAQMSGDPRSEGMYRAHLGLLLARLGRPDDARSCFVAGANLLRQVGDLAGLALLRCKKAQAEASLGDAAAGLDEFRQAEAFAIQNPPDADSELARALNAARVAVIPA